MGARARTATVLLLLVLAGCGGDEEPASVPSAPTQDTTADAAESVSAETGALTCAQVGGQADADIEATERLATAVAVEFRGRIDLDESNVVKGLFAAALAACAKAGDPAHEPLADLREVAEKAAASESPLSVIFGGEEQPEDSTPEPASAPPVADVAGTVSDACAALPPQVAQQMADAESLSVDDSTDVRLEVATLTGTIASLSEALGFSRAIEAFATQANELAIERDVQGFEQSTATDSQIENARADALEEAEALGAEACIALLGG